MAPSNGHAPAAVPDWSRISHCVVIVRAFDKQQQIMYGLNLCVEPVLSHVHLMLITGVVIVRAFDKQQQIMYGLNLCVLGQSMAV